jgi:hypothetical protein
VTALPGFAQDAATEAEYETIRSKKVATAVRVTEQINIDGFLEEPAWKLAVPATGFIQRRPNTGKPAPEPTEVRFLYDNDNLYVGFFCFDSDAAHLTVHDMTKDFQLLRSDSIAITIDSTHEQRSNYYFRTNPVGAKSDAQGIDGGMNYDWDAVWDVKTSINSQGWIAEFVIPFRTLRFSKSSQQVWGINMSRKLLRLNAEMDWSPIPIRYSISRTSTYGTLLGLENIKQGRNLKVTPFVTAGVTQVRRANNPTDGLENDQDYDGGVDLKYSITPSLTLDGTYRTDFAQVEVDQQQVNLTRFNLFFPEKRDFFLENSGVFTFGRGNNLVPFFSRRIGLSATGTPIPIIGGGRVSGQIGHYDVGFLAMKTKGSGVIPSNNYVVGRFKRNLFRNSWVGALTTSRDATLSGDTNRVYGADAHFQIYDHLWIDSNVLQSKTPHLSGSDQARQFEAAWRGNELTVEAGYNQIQKNFNPEVGFIRRGNNKRYNGEFSWKPVIETSNVIRNLEFGTSTEYFGGDATGKIETRTEQLNLGIEFQNNAAINFAMTDTFDRLTEPFNIRTGIAIPTGDYRYLGYAADATTNPGRRLSGNTSVEWGEFWNGRHNSLRGGINWRPDYHLNISVDDRRDHIVLPSGHFTTDLVGLRISYALSPRTFFNAYFQYNSATHQVSSNVRFNIIHHPLSDFFLVYNELRDSTGRIQQRAVVLKVTNLFNF